MLNQPGAGVSSASVITIADGDIATSKLGLGEYTIVVSDYQINSGGNKSANIEVFDPDGFSIGQ